MAAENEQNQPSEFDRMLDILDPEKLEDEADAAADPAAGAGEKDSAKADEEAGTHAGGTPDAGDKKEAATGDGEKGEKGETAAEKDAAEDTTPKAETTEEKLARLEHENLTYRQALRAMKKQTSADASAVNELRASLEKEGVIKPDDSEEAKQQQAAAAFRQQTMRSFLENMRISDKYGDVDAVVTQRRADDLFEVLGAEYAKKNNVPLDQAVSHVEAYVWNKVENPYRWLYDTLKKLHPDFTAAMPGAGTGASAKAGEADKGTKTAAGSTAGKSPVEAPTSLQNLGGSDDSATTWTAAKIDALDEEELGKVPSPIYEKWLTGELR